MCPTVRPTKAALARSAAIQSEIWAEAVSAGRAVFPQPAAMLLLPALNQMIDITTTRSGRDAEPSAIDHFYNAHFSSLLLSALLAGYNMACSNSRIHMLVFAAILSITVYVILDLEYPRLGLVQDRCSRPGTNRRTAEYEVSCKVDSIILEGVIEYFCW